MMILVHMLAFHDDKLRPVFIPDDEIPADADRETLAGLTFHYGQNEFATGPYAETLRTSTCSVSVGDVIEFEDGARLMVIPFGFHGLSADEYAAHKKTPQRDRSFNAYKFRARI